MGVVRTGFGGHFFVEVRTLIWLTFRPLAGGETSRHFYFYSPPKSIRSWCRCSFDLFLFFISNNIRPFFFVLWIHFLGMFLHKKEIIVDLFFFFNCLIRIEIQSIKKMRFGIRILIRILRTQNTANNWPLNQRAGSARLQALRPAHCPGKSFCSRVFPR